jgi:hypothetical protein
VRSYPTVEPGTRKVNRGTLNLRSYSKIRIWRDLVEGKEYQTVILAGLLHDTSKFLQRGSFGSLNVAGRHPEVSCQKDANPRKGIETGTDREKR